MTPVASWCPDDYYRASRAARAAWERTDRQLVIGLDEAAAGTTPSVAAVSSSPSSPADDADSHGEPPWNGEGGLEMTAGSTPACARPGTDTGHGRSAGGSRPSRGETTPRQEN